MVYVGEDAYDWQAGLTVADLLACLPDGDHYAVVKMNGKLVSRPSFKTVQVPDDARIDLIPMVAGG